ncbi:MAG: hypothetical protein WDN75_10130 [Bacteroidota bacterium]
MKGTKKKLESINQNPAEVLKLIGKKLAKKERSSVIITAMIFPTTAV